MTRNEAEIEVGDTPVIEVESVGVGEEERSVLMGVWIGYAVSG